MELLPSGLPVDRTVCPDCRNDQRIVADCPMCNGYGVVCPVCRGCGLVNLNRANENPVSTYQPCDCAEPDIDPDTGKQRQSKMTGRLLWRRNQQRTVDAILRYRDAQQREPQPPPVAPEPAYVGADSDPWDELTF